jgi:glycosyltransferase involved in cell wall biosynthesis
MARLLMKALERAGFAPWLSSELRTLDKAGSASAQQDLERAARNEADRIIERVRSLPQEQRPRLWLTYHVYYKAPDWIGPAVSRALGIPYVVAEGSISPKRASGPWALGHAAAERALASADVLLVMTRHDRAALEIMRERKGILVDFPPFIDAAEWGEPVRTGRDPARLLTVAMMRDGDKLASYRILSEALRMVEHDWTLRIVGGGPARHEVEQLFAPFGPRVTFIGQVEDKRELRSLYEEAALFVWPAVNEAYGMVLLEAQLCGCPVVAGSFGGVESVVEDAVTGVLTPPGDTRAFAEAIESLLVDPARARESGEAAAAFVRHKRNIDIAAALLSEVLTPLVARCAA